MMENTPLKYLFVAIFEDGSTIEQTPEDVSTKDPKKSAFYDVMTSEKPLQALVLRSLDGNVQAAVSLEDGHFEIDGTVFFVGDIPEGRRELIYVRRNFRHFTLGLDQIGHEIHYYIGWRSLEDPSVERVIGVL